MSDYRGAITAGMKIIHPMQSTVAAAAQKWIWRAKMNNKPTYKKMAHLSHKPGVMNNDH